MADPIPSTTPVLDPADLRKILQAPRVTLDMVRVASDTSQGVEALTQRIARGFAEDGLSSTRPAVFNRDHYLTTVKDIVERFHRYRFVGDAEKLGSYIFYLSWGMCATCGEGLFPTWYSKAHAWAFGQPHAPDSPNERRFGPQVSTAALPWLRAGNLIGYHTLCKPLLCTTCSTPILTALELYVAVRQGRSTCETCFAKSLIGVQPERLSIAHRRRLAGRNAW